LLGKRIDIRASEHPHAADAPYRHDESSSAGEMTHHVRRQTQHAGSIARRHQIVCTLWFSVTRHPASVKPKAQCVPPDFARYGLSYITARVLITSPSV
jgi:hypothetical protein